MGQEPQVDGRIAQPGWCHEIAGDVRETYVQKRMPEVLSAESVNADLRLLRLFFNVLGDWKHRPEDSNPFSGRGRASVGARQKRAKQRTKETKPEHFTRQQIIVLLDQADREIAERPDDWGRRRLQALVYFAAYTGARIGEVLHLEWDEIDWEAGIAWLNFNRSYAISVRLFRNLTFNAMPRQPNPPKLNRIDVVLRTDDH